MTEGQRPERFATRSQMVTWDWKEYAPLENIGRAVENISDGQVHLYEIDTGSDQFAILISNGTYDKTQVAEIYQDWRRDG